MGLFINGTQVAEPAKGGVVITEGPVWSENTGRDVNSGKMIGDIVAWKKTVAVTWPPLTFAQVNTIIQQIKAGGAFFKIKYNDSSASSLKEITVYSSNLSRTIESISAAYKRQTGVTVSFIEQ